MRTAFQVFLWVIVIWWLLAYLAPLQAVLVLAVLILLALALKFAWRGLAKLRRKTP